MGFLDIVICSVMLSKIKINFLRDLCNVPHIFILYYAHDVTEHLTGPFLLCRPPQSVLMVRKKISQEY